MMLKKRIGAYLSRAVIGMTVALLVAAPFHSDARASQGEISYEIAVTLPAPSGHEASAHAAGKASAKQSCDPVPRAEKDRPDLRDGHLVHVVYLLPSDGKDEGLDTDGTLNCSTQAQNLWFEEASGGMRWRIDTFKTTITRGGKPRSVEATDVTLVRSGLPGSELASAFDVEAELRNLGFSDDNKRYLSFVAAEAGPCGDAIYPISVGVPSAVDGHYAQVYLFSPEGCKAHEFGVPGAPSFAEMIAQQELIHNDGLSPPAAPHGCLGGIPPGLAHVCTGPLVFTEGVLNLDPERVDIMYPYVSVPLSEKVLDIGNDDYFDHPFPHMNDLKNSPYVEGA
jgi:hypothetical protein